MRCHRLLIGFVVVLLASCGDEASTPTPEDEPWLWVDSGGSSIPLPRHEEARLIQDDVVAVLRGLWEGIGESGSVEFQVRGNRALDISSEHEVGDGAETTISIEGEANVVMTSTPYRFFKRREGPPASRRRSRSPPARR